jgi:signal transduction histidine kinase
VKATARAGGRVLVVEDDADFAESLLELLDSDGFQARSAQNIGAALLALEEFSADVALIDVKLGTEDGVSLVPLLKRQRPKLVCILMTAYASLESAVQAVKNGADDYLFKPLQPSKLTERLHNVIGQVESTERDKREQRLLLLGQLSAGVAHDVNNYLQAMLLDLDDTRVALASTPPDIRTALERCDALRSAINASADVCGRLVTFAKGQAKNESCDARVVVSSSQPLLQRLVGPTATLLIEAGSEPLPVPCGATELQQVLMNLALNAAHAIGEHGTIEIVVRRAAGTDQRVHLRVSDDGAGIPENVVSRIFEPYFTTKARAHGTGLGLAVVHGIVVGAGGQIDVRTDLGHGTVFDVYLPLLAPSPAPLGAEPPRDPEPQATLLVIDDFRPLLTSLRRAFEREGYVVVCAEAAEAGLAELQGQPQRFAAVVSDVSLPGMSGIELARSVRRSWPDLPIVLMSGDETVAGVSELGANTLFLRKPFVPHAVVEWFESLGLEARAAPRS